MADIGRQSGGASILDRGDVVAGCGIPTNVEGGEGRIGEPLATPKCWRTYRWPVEEVAEMLVDPRLDCVARSKGKRDYCHRLTVAAWRGFCPLRQSEAPTASSVPGATLQRPHRLGSKRGSTLALYRRTGWTSAEITTIVGSACIEIACALVIGP